MAVDPDLWWTVLVDALRSLGAVEDRDPHGLVLSLSKPDGSSAVVDIVMTRNQWDDFVSTPWGDVDAAADHVAALVLAQPTDQGYLVYDCYELFPRDVAEPPVDSDLLRLQEIAAQYPDGVIAGGGWYVCGPEDE